MKSVNEFFIKGKEGFIRIELKEVFGFPDLTSNFGGYDVQGRIEIKSGNYYVNGELWFTTGEIYEFHEQLASCYRKLSGVATFWTSETNLKIEIKFDKLGQITIDGYFQEKAYQENKLKFEIESDQSFFEETIKGLKKIVDYYGDLKGVKNK